MAVAALVRIDAEGAFANLVLPSVLEVSGLDDRDRRLVTELVYGTTRMRRACDWLIDPHVRARRALDPPTRAALRVGTYQLRFLRQPAHAAVDSAVEAAPTRSRGLVNAVLRKVATGPVRWPDDATRLSYPDWVVARLNNDLGSSAATAALVMMNRAPVVEIRDDGYVQDRASLWVADAVGARPGERILDLCAAPGGKATALAGSGAFVVAGDSRLRRARLVADNLRQTGTGDHVAALVADGRQPPFDPGTFDRVLVDAPCSGLGVLRRRADARWRVSADGVARLATLQVRLLDAAADLVRPGGTVVYSVCTLTSAETLEVDAEMAWRRPELVPGPPPGAPWTPVRRGARLLPQAAGTDGMALFRYRRS